MPADDRNEWTATTHDWTLDVDLAHLESIRLSRAGHERGGRRHQMLEVLAYADDEADALGRLGNVVVRITSDDLVSITDDGRGTDTRTDASGNVVRKPIMATEDLRFFDAAHPPLLPDGLPRRGISTVAALSSTLCHENHRADGAWVQTYHHGIPETTLRKIATAARTGTVIRFASELGEPARLTAADLQAFTWLEIRYTDETD